MTYLVKEIFYTVQGEGRHTGAPSVFLRFALCNLWTGRQQDRHRAICKFCDTDFVGIGPDGGRFSDAQACADAVLAAWKGGATSRRVVCTGGEPLLQLDTPLVAALRARGFEVAVETNGTLPLPDGGVDWVCVSPKAGADFNLRGGDELKVVYPQTGLDPADYTDLQFDHWSLQPLDDANLTANTRAVVDYCLAHPKWRVSLQTHKLIGVR